LTTQTSTAQIPARFGVTFLLLAVLSTWITSIDAVAEQVQVPLSRLVTFLSAQILSVLGNVSVSQNFLSFKGFSVEIVEACNGVLPMLIYVAAILAFPSRWRAKACGVLIGIPAIFGINLIRVVTLMIFGASWPQVFDFVHIYVWEALVIALTMGVWVFWVELFVRRAGAAGR